MLEKGFEFDPELVAAIHSIKQYFGCTSPDVQPIGFDNGAHRAKHVLKCILGSSVQEIDNCLDDAAKIDVSEFDQEDFEKFILNHIGPAVTRACQTAADPEADMFKGSARQELHREPCTAGPSAQAR